MFQTIFNRRLSWSLFTIIMVIVSIVLIYDKFSYDKDMDNFEKQDRLRSYGHMPS